MSLIYELVADSAQQKPISHRDLANFSNWAEILKKQHKFFLIIMI